MDIDALSRIAKIAILTLLFLCGCAGPGRGPLVVTDRPSPDVHLSPELQLLDVPIKKISAAIDQDGLVHILALAEKPLELHHLVVGKEGVLSQEVVTSLDSCDHLDIAFDGSGNLHAIVNQDHFVLEEGVWRTLQQHRCIEFIRGGDDLFCASVVEGKDVGAPGNWDWHLVAAGGYGAAVCCLIPWHSYPDKFVLAKKTPTGWSRLALLDVETKFEIESFAVAADKSSTLHLLYKTREGGNIIVDAQCVYARIEPIKRGESSENEERYGSNEEEEPSKLAKFSGQIITSDSQSMGRLDCHDIAVDPDTGTALITIKKYDYYPPRSYSHIVEDGKIGPQVQMYDFDGAIHVEPAGDGRFLALGVWSDQGSWTRTQFIYYLEYLDGTWSAPVELAKGELYNAVLLSDLNRRAFALWTNKNGRPIARWIER